LREAGVELVVGTDGGLTANPVSQGLWQELDAWVQYLGFTPAEAIQRSTSFAAALMGAGNGIVSLRHTFAKPTSEMPYFLANVHVGTDQTSW